MISKQCQPRHKSNCLQLVQFQAWAEAPELEPFMHQRLTLPMNDLVKKALDSVTAKALDMMDADAKKQISLSSWDGDSLRAKGFSRTLACHVLDALPAAAYGKTSIADLPLVQYPTMLETLTRFEYDQSVFQTLPDHVVSLYDEGGPLDFLPEPQWSKWHSLHWASRSATLHAAGTIQGCYEISAVRYKQLSLGIRVLVSRMGLYFGSASIGE